MKDINSDFSKMPNDPPFFILDDERNAVPVKSLHEWVDWKFRNQGACRVAYDELGDIAVSTVFDGFSLSMDGEKRPFVFETMTFFGQRSGQSSRCTTWADAEAQHAAALALAKAERGAS